MYTIIARDNMKVSWSPLRSILICTANDWGILSFKSNNLESDQRSNIRDLKIWYGEAVYCLN